MVRLNCPSEARHQRPPVGCGSVMPRPGRLIRSDRFGQTRLQRLHRRLWHELDRQQQSAWPYDAGHLCQRLLLQGRAKLRQRVGGPCRIEASSAKRQRPGRPRHPVEFTPTHPAIDRLPFVAPGIDHDTPAVWNVVHRRFRQITPVALDLEHAAGERKCRKQAGALKQPVRPQPPEPIHRYRNHRSGCPRLAARHCHCSSTIAMAPLDRRHQGMTRSAANA